MRRFSCSLKVPLLTSLESLFSNCTCVKDNSASLNDDEVTLKEKLICREQENFYTTLKLKFNENLISWMRGNIIAIPNFNYRISISCKVFLLNLLFS